VNGASINDQIRELCRQASTLELPTEHAERVAAISSRLEEPLRVALAGRTKAGKSTLLNALVGERLAASDASECTRIVTWYRHGIAYGVEASMRDGRRVPLPFARAEGRLEIGLGSANDDDIDHISIRWPSSKLANITYVDTPGIASVNEHVSGRTFEALMSESDDPGDVDAVVYLMRHAHGRDDAFLEAFQDRATAHASPVNAIAILSRADELGGGRPEALQSAEKIAGRYRSDDRVRRLVATVAPVSGLLALTAQTLQEREANLIREVASMPPDSLASALLSADRFLTSLDVGVTADDRRHLIDRLGMFGLRYSVAQLRTGNASTSSELSRSLLRLSAIDRVRQLLEGHFAARARALKARSAVQALRAAAESLRSAGDPQGERMLAAIERLEAGATDLARLRLVHLAMSGAAKLSNSDRLEIDRITAEAPPAKALGLEPGAAGSALQSAALTGIRKWRERGNRPLSDPATTEACELATRIYEQLYASSA
jgi:energy-coupling factor transporter ATP-binding protein EcfA2